MRYQTSAVILFLLASAILLANDSKRAQKHYSVSDEQYVQAIKKWNYSYKNLAELVQGLEAFEQEFQANGVSEALKPIVSKIKEYGFSNWVDSGEIPERKTREAISRYNDTIIEVYLNKELPSGVIENAASHLLWSTDPNSLARDDLERLTDHGRSNKPVYVILQNLGLYEGYVEQLYTKAYMESPSEKMMLAVSLGLEAAAPYMLELVSQPFDPESLIPEKSMVSTLDENDKRIQIEKVVYQFVQGGSAQNLRYLCIWLSNCKTRFPEFEEPLKQRLREIEASFPGVSIAGFTNKIRNAIQRYERDAESKLESVLAFVEPPEEQRATNPVDDAPAESKNMETARAEPEEARSVSWLGLLCLFLILIGILFGIKRR